jgi:hypothetical protein
LKDIGIYLKYNLKKMKQKNIKGSYILLALIAVLYMGCSKTSNPATMNNNPMLAKKITVSSCSNATDSVTLNFSYNISGHISSVQASVGEGGNAEIGALNVERDDNGFISSASFAAGSDNNVIQVFTNPVSLQYLSSTSKINYDSVVFTYTNNKITDEIYYSTYGSVNPALKLDFFYDALGNIDSIIHSYYNLSSWVPFSTSVWTYDNKPNPLQLGNESLILATADNQGGGFADEGDGEMFMFGCTGVNNPLTEVSTITNANYPGYSVGEERTLTSTYTYNTNGTPATSSTFNSFTPSCGNSTTTFGY